MRQLLFKKTLAGLLLLTAFMLQGCGPADNSIAGDTPFTFVDSPAKTLADFQGKWLLVNFWSVTCPPCYEEMPDLDRFHNEGQHRDWSVIGVAMPYDRPDSVLAAVKKMQISYPVAIDIEAKTNIAFGTVTLVPSSYLLDPQGHIVKQFTGKVTYKDLLKTLRKAIKNYSQRS